MTASIANQILNLEKRQFVIGDKIKVSGYLEKVGYHRLSFYFKNAAGDIDRVIGLYIFDKRLRLLILDMLEVIENALKSVMINSVGHTFHNNFWYSDPSVYQKQNVDKRLSFIFSKIADLKQKDPTVKYFFDNHPLETNIPDYIFFDKLTFGELLKIFEDLDFDHQKIIAKYFGIYPTIFVSWMKNLHYLRNLCSHYENIFNRKMTFAIRGEKFTEVLGSNNTFVSYFAILSIFNKVLIDNYNWGEKVVELMKKFNISLQDFGQKENLPSELESEAWEVLVNPLYGKYVKKSNQI